MALTFQITEQLTEEVIILFNDRRDGANVRIPEAGLGFDGGTGSNFRLGRSIQQLILIVSTAAIVGSIIIMVIIMVSD